MSADPKECREQAKRCLRLAAEANDSVLRDSLTDTAHRWERLAAELQSGHDNLAMELVTAKQVLNVRGGS